MEPNSPAKAAVGAESREERRRSIETRWKKQVTSPGNEAAVGDDAATFGAICGDDNAVWGSALNRFAQDTLPASEPRGSNVFQESDYPSQVQFQERGDLSITRSNRDTSDLSMPEKDSEEESSDCDFFRSNDCDSPARTDIEQSMTKLSLWQTFKVLYQKHHMVKFYIAGLLIFLISTFAIIGVIVSQISGASTKDCSSASYNDGQILLTPDESLTVIAGGFGSSISASNELLVVGAPDSECNSLKSSCNSFTAGGGAYLYSRNSKNEWALHSSFALDDGTSSGDQYGKSVAIASDSTILVVGAPENNPFGVASGAIYVMEQPFGSTSPAIRLVSEDLGVNDQFGGSVGVAVTSIGSDTSVRVTNIVVGASSDDEFGFSSGSVYVFSKYESEPPASACGGIVKVGKWVQCQKLLPDDGQSNDLFGKAVHVSGKTIVVGAMWDDAKGIDSGAAYVFFLGDDGIWSFQQELHPTNFESQADRFGISVATSGDRIVVGADLDNTHGEDAGAAYVYRLSGGVWGLESKLVASVDPGIAGNRGFNCGFSVGINEAGTMIVVGCPGAPTGGAAYMYLREDGIWFQKTKFRIPEDQYPDNVELGSSVTLSGDVAIVGSGEIGKVFSYTKDC